MLLFALAACTPMAALLMPSAPLLSAALASRGDDSATAEAIRDLQVKRDWAGLTRLANERIALNPEDADWWVVLGYAALQRKELAEAVKILDTAVTRAPEDIDALNLLAEAQRLSGQVARATRTLKRAMTVDPSSPISRYLLGEAYRDEGLLSRARESYAEAVRLEPEFILAWYGLVKVLERTGPQEDRDTALARLRKLDPVLAQEFSDAGESKPAGNSAR